MLALGVSLVVAIPLLTAALAGSAGAQTIRRTVEHLNPADRTLVVSQETTSVLRHGTTAQNDRQVRGALATLTASPAVRALLYRPLTVGGATVQLGGADALASFTRPVVGRAPRICTPSRCEVITVGDALPPTAVRGAAALGIVVVGRATSTAPSLRAVVSASTPLLLADGADPVARLRALALFSRRYSWTAALDADRIVTIGVPAYVGRTAAVGARLDDAVGGTSLQAPTAALQQAADRAEASARRLRLLGGFAAVLLLGFAVITAINLRRDARALATVLRRRGATAAQVVTVTLLQMAAGVALGVVGGGVLGVLGAAVFAGGRGSGSAAADAVPAGAATDALRVGAPTALLLALAAAAVGAAVLLAPDTSAAALWRSLDLVALGCLGAAVLAGTRGAASASAVAAASDPLVVALPVLASVVAGLVAARVWRPVLGAVERVLPRRSLAERIALLGATRRPLLPVATAGFLTAAVASVLFATAYRATLTANNADQAAYRVPLGVSVDPGESQVVPSLPATVAGARTFGVLRAPVSITRLPGVIDSIPLVAPPAAALPLVARWARTTGSGVAPARLAAALRRPVPVRPALPAGTRTVTISAGGVDPQTSLALWLATADGRQVRVGLSGVGGRLIGRVPSVGRTHVVAFGVDESGDYAAHHEHAVGEGRTDRPLLTGRLVLGAVRADGAAVPWSWRGWGSRLGSASATAEVLRLGYRLNGAPVVAVPDFAAVRDAVLPVAVDPRTAHDAHSGDLALTVDGSAAMRAQVVATLPRLPSVRGPFVLADAAAVHVLLDQRQPGRNVDRYWVSGASPAAVHALRATGATVTERASVRAELDADPVGRNTGRLLLVVALLALAVAAASLVLLVLGERRDGAGELFAWEADGVPPGVLRRVLALRAAAVAAVAMPLGVVAGLVIARVGTALLPVDASGSVPMPPLQVSLGSRWSVLLLALGLGGGLAVAVAVAARMLRERFPVPAEAELR